MAVAALQLDEQTEPMDMLAERGYRLKRVKLPDGSIDYEQIPLTEEEYLYPKEGYVMPNSTFHDTTVGELRDMLKRRYHDDPTVGVYSDLSVRWDTQRKEHCPDVFVAMGVRDRDAFRSKFIVTQEGVRPRVIFEVVSPAYRKADREKKVIHYARVGVPEYIILDRRGRGQPVYEVLGYVLAQGHYNPVAPDEDGRILCRALNLWIGLDSRGQVVMEDARTGERIPLSTELADLLRAEQAARGAAEAQAETERKAREAAEARLRQLEARLQALGVQDDESLR